MKKLLLTLAAGTCALCCAFGLSACNFGGNNKPQMLTFTLSDDGESYSVSFDYHYDFRATSEIVIPSTYQGKPVTRIADNNHGFPTATSDGAFTVTIPESVTTIDAYAFGGCAALTGVNIPSGVTAIENFTFASCESLTSIVIPDGVTSIGESAFYECFALKSVKIGGGVKSIGKGAFYHSGLTSVDIPDSVESIDDGAFAQCKSLKSIKIGNGIQSIGVESNSGMEPAFFECGIETAVIPAVACTALMHDPTTVASLKSVVITSGDEIGRYAFNNFSELASVEIADGITKIGDNAFSHCSNLKSIKIPNSVTSISASAFEFSAVETAELPAGACTSNIAKNNDNLKTVKITSGAEIPAQSFNGCTHLASITIPSTVTKINDNTFYRCDNITSISYAGEIAGWCAIQGLGNLTRNSTKSLTIGGKKIEGTLIIPEAALGISDYAFAYCGDIDSVLLPKTTSVAEHSFSGDNIFTLYYTGTAYDWDSANIGSVNLRSAHRYYYSVDKPELNQGGTGFVGDYWHYAADNVTPVIWEITD